MNQKPFILILGLCFIMVQISFAQGIEFFTGTHEQFEYKTQSSGKPYILEFYTDWCQPCKVMEKTTFSDYEVGSYANEHFLSYRVNPENFDHFNLAQEHNIKVYPTIMFFDEQGTLIRKITGLYSTLAFLDILKEVRRDWATFNYSKASF